jgi:hypothetical protein
MKQTGSDKTLESSKVFPYFAWGLVILFTFLVYQITLNLRLAAADLHAQTEFIQTQTKTNPTEIKNFQPPAFKENSSTSPQNLTHINPS